VTVLGEVIEAKVTLAPYLNFNGNTAEAMRFYPRVLGGELKMETFAEAGFSSGPQDKNRIMHAVLNSDEIIFMASDGRPEMKVSFGDNVRLSHQSTDKERLTKIFNVLAEGGKVEYPLAKAQWGTHSGCSPTSSASTGWSTSPPRRASTTYSCPDIFQSTVSIDSSHFT